MNLIKDWYAPSELEGLPELPNDRNDIRRKAHREGWQSRPRSGKGGGEEYHFDSLPPETQVYLMQAAGQRPTPAQPAPKGADLRELDPPSAAPETNAERRIWARVHLLKAHAVYCQDAPRVVDCEYRFANAYNSGEILVPDWVRDTVGTTLSRTALRDWQQKLKNGELLKLGGTYGHARGKNLIDSQPVLRHWLVSLLGRYPKITPYKAWIALHTRFSRDLVPSRSTVNRWLNQWHEENRQQAALLANPDDWKNRFMPAYGSASEGIERVNQVWELDSTPADVMLVDGRYHLVGCIDVYSRRGMLLVTRTSSAAAISALLRKAILAWGVPEAIRTDNGKDYTALHIQHVLMALGIEHKLCAPFTPEQKPHIERFLKTFSHDLTELLPGYIGHNVAERKAIEAQQSFAERFGKRGETIELPLDRVQLQAICNDWTENLYAHRPHEGIQGKTPFSRAAGATIQQIKDERVLDLLMTESGTRTVQKKGIKFGNAWYINADLQPLTGYQVHLRLPDDLGQIYVFKGPDCREFVCVAECPELTGMNRQAEALKAKAWAKQQKQAARAIRELGQAEDIRTLPQTILDNARNTAQKIVAMRHEQEDYTSAGVVAAQDLLTKLNEPAQPQEWTAEQEARFQASEAERLEAEALKAALEDPIDRYDRLRKARNKGASIGESDRAWMERFEKNPKNQPLIRSYEAFEAMDSQAM